jgi:hypothetical protein
MTYNLLDPASVEQAIKNSVPCMAGHSVASIKAAMEQFRALKTNPQFFNFDTEGVCTVSGKDWGEANPVDNILNVGFRLILNRSNQVVFRPFISSFISLAKNSSENVDYDITKNHHQEKCKDGVVASKFIKVHVKSSILGYLIFHKFLLSIRRQDNPWRT